MITSRQEKNVGIKRNREIAYNRRKVNMIWVEMTHIAN